MSERGLLVCSLTGLVGALVVGAWLITTGQVRTVDGLFLLCSCGVLAFASLLYLRYLIKSVTGSAAAPRRENAPPRAVAVSRERVAS